MTERTGKGHGPGAARSAALDRARLRAPGQPEGLRGWTGPVQGDALPPSADVVVIGGGVCGTSIAYHAAREGATVALVEARELASGASGRNAGMVYQGEGGADAKRLIGLTTRSRRLLGEYAAAWGDPFALVPCGTLDVLFTEAGVEEYRAAVAAQVAAGLEACMVSGDEARAREPLLSDDVIAARWCPSDAKLIPYELVYAFARQASALGATISTWSPVSKILVAGDRVQGVETPRGSVRAGQVVIATNAWAPDLAGAVGVELPIVPRHGQILVTAPAPPALRFTANLLTPDTVTYGYWRTMPDGQVVMGGGGFGSPPVDRYRVDLDPGLLGGMVRAVSRATPALAALPAVRAWAGTMAFTPDMAPIVGPLARPAGLSVAAGFCGSGMPFSAAVGEGMAAILAGRREPVSFAGVSPARFAL